MNFTHFKAIYDNSGFLGNGGDSGVIDGTQQEYYIEPLRSEFESESAYNAALLEYKKLKWRYILANLKK